MTTDALLRPDGPWLHPLVAADSTAWDLLQSLRKESTTPIAPLMVRGKKMRTTQGLYDEFAAALQFPYYFGENADAFDECINDLEWLDADAYAILISESLHLLEAEPAERLTALLHTLERTGQEWGKPMRGEFARPARAFHVLLQCTSAEEPLLREKLTTAKVAFSPIA